MILRYSSTSPFVRKVTVAAAEMGLADRIAWKNTNAWDPAGDLPGDNPLGKVPTMVLDSGETLYDSRVICEYLDSLHDGEKLLPSDGERRWRTLKLEALADGMMDASVLRLIEEQRRPAEYRWPDWIERQQEKVERGLDVLEQNSERLEERLTIAHVTAACALGYLDFRFSSVAWRENRPRLAAWFEVFAERPSMRETSPKAA